MKCIWLSTDGKLLYITIKEQAGDDEKYIIVSIDNNGEILSRFDINESKVIPTEQFLYYMKGKSIYCLSLESGEEIKFAEIPVESEYESVVDFGMWKDEFYLLCYRPGEAYVIYQYKVSLQEWEILYFQQLEDSDWIYKRFSDDFHIQNGKIFLKEWVSEGKGELWHQIDIRSDEKIIFENMEPFDGITVQTEDIFSGITEKSKSYLKQDYVLDEVTEDEDGNLIKTNIILPQMNEKILAYQEINHKIQKDAEDFYKEQIEFAEYIKDASDEWENESHGYWNYVYVYADSDYVSIVYWKFIGRNGLSDIKTDQYEVRLYSSITGEEIDIEDLFFTDKEEVLLRFSYAIRKTECGLRFFQDDVEMLKRHGSDYKKSYYLLTEEGIDIFFVESVRTNIINFILDYEELEDILY